ncbi:MAG TPA: DUF6084 family protein [Gemmatimonadales bacterium]
MAAPLPAVGAAPELTFAVEGVVAMRYSVGPSLGFRLTVGRADGGTIESVLLQVQIRLAAGGRRYQPVEQERLANIFGRGDQWARSVGSLHWTNVTAVVPPFTGHTSIELPVSLTYDFEVTSAQYLQALDDGETPVDLLFSGTIFYLDADGLLQAAMIPWEQEARCKLPVAVWREAMDSHFPDAAWIRMSRATFDQLQLYRAGRAATDWDDPIRTLLRTAHE